MPRLLFITSTRIGDAVLSTGVLEHFLGQMPGARVTVAAGRPALPLFRAVPGLDRLIPIDKRRHGAHWLALWRAVAARRWDLVIDLRASAIAYLLWTRRRKVMPRRLPDLHRLEELGRVLGLPAPPAPKLWLGEAERRRARELVPDGPPVLALAPAANWAGKQWRPERFAELARRLTAADGILPAARLAVFAGPDEREQVAPVLAALPAGRVLDLVGGPDLLTVGACLARCDLFVGNDSGLMHLAAAAGTPTLGLFGPSHEWRYRPWGEKAAALRTPESYEELTGAPDYDHRTTGTLMDGLSVEAVAEAAAALRRRCGGGAC